MNYEDFIQEGLVILKRNLETFPPYESSQPYDEKNSYFLDNYKHSYILFQTEETLVIAERYYQALIATIIKYENDTGKKFNKGMAFANIGVAQLASHKFDLGITSFLAADSEDEYHISHRHGIFNSTLWSQFEKPRVVDYLTTLN